MAKVYCIVGNGVAGDAAASVIKERDPKSEVIVFTEEGKALYNRILLKEFAKGKLNQNSVDIRDEDWYLSRGIDIMLNAQVTRIDSENKIIEWNTGSHQKYDQVLVATGGTPRELNVPNSGAEGIHHFWTMKDTIGIRNHAETASFGAVIGAGLLGIDLAAICGAHGVDSKYIMRGDVWWRNALSKIGGEIIHKSLRDRNVLPVFNKEIECFEERRGKVQAVVTTDGERHEADFVGVAVGLDYNIELVQNTDIEYRNGIVVDEHMFTGVEGIYAAGDIARYHDVIIGEEMQNGSWGSAKKQGMVAGENMVNGNGYKKFEWIPSYSITHFEYPIISFGHPTKGEKFLEKKYGGNEWRRLAFKQGRLIGGVLIGDVSSQSRYKKIIREKVERVDQEMSILDKKIDLEKIVIKKT